MRGSYQPFSSWKSATNMWSVKSWPKPRSASLGLLLSVAVLLILIGSDMIRLLSKNDRLAVEPVDLPIHVGDLAQRYVVLHGVDQHRHDVVAVAARLGELLQTPLDPRLVARGLHPLHALDLLELDALVDTQELDGLLLGHHVLVHADDD